MAFLHVGAEASKFKFLCRRAKNSHCKALKDLKAELIAYLPKKKKPTYAGLGRDKKVRQGATQIMLAGFLCSLFLYKGVLQAGGEFFTFHTRLAARTMSWTMRLLSSLMMTVSPGQASSQALQPCPRVRLL